MNTKENIENEDAALKAIAPNLFKVKNGNPFKTEADYFESFASTIQNQIDEYEAIKADAPLLSDIPKYNPFEVPLDYFEELPTLIQQRVANQKSTTSVKEWLLLIIKPRFAFPVLTIILIAIGGINFMTKNAEVPKSEIAEVVTTEEQLYNIDEATIIESVANQSTNETETIQNDDSNIKNYLIDNNIDESNLNTEL